MPLTLTIDPELCKGCALCMMASPELFDIDEPSGKAVVLEAHPSEEQRAAAEDAVQGCPSGAIALVEAD